MNLAMDRKIVMQQKDEVTQIYANTFYYMEANTASMLKQLDVTYDVPDIEIEAALRKIEKQTKMDLDEHQVEAVKEAVRNGLLIITGGPGTGKTTTINTIIKYFELEGMDIFLAAPTGRAAKRMSETTGYEARTIHRMLELNGGMDQTSAAGFERNEQNPLETDVIIIDELGASMSYNMAAKTQPWSNLSTRLRLKWGKTTFNMNAVFNTYAYEFDKNGNVVVGNRTEWSYGRFGRFQGMSKNLSYTFNNQSFKKIRDSIRRLFGQKVEAEDETNTNETEGEETDNLETNTEKDTEKKPDSKYGDDGLDKDGYMRFTMPWSFSISYGVTMAEDRSKDINVKNMRYPYKFTQNMNFSGSLKLSDGWNCSFSSGWDFTTKKISMTTVNISRDMHCFNMSCGLVFGTYTSYHISLRANASTLTDALKYDKKSSYSGAIQWY